MGRRLRDEVVCAGFEGPDAEATSVMCPRPHGWMKVSSAWPFLKDLSLHETDTSSGQSPICLCTLPLCPSLGMA